MNFTILVSDDAENDLDESFLWYEGQSYGLGEKFIHYINDGLSFIRTNPKSSSEVFMGIVRKHIIEKFPFAIYYILNEPEKRIEIIAILHFKRGENIWKGRI